MFSRYLMHQILAEILYNGLATVNDNDLRRQSS